MVKDGLKGVSVIVCCYNSARRLPDTIRHLAEQKVSPEIEWEVIIVDNASVDNTATVANQQWAKYNTTASFKVVGEEKPGLSAARHKGYTTSRFEYLIFCDDDNWLQADYVQLAYNLMEERPGVAILGGQSKAAFESDPPAWFHKYAMSYAVGRQYDFSGDVTFNDRKLWGAGSVVRKEALSYLYQNGFRQLLSDRIGNKIVSGGDHELCFALRLAGYQLYYDDRLLFVHFMSSSRLNWNWYINFYRNSAFTSLYFDPYNKVTQSFKGVSGFLKSTALYELYLSCRLLLKNKTSFRFLLYSPEPDSSDTWFVAFYEKNRMLGLLKHLFTYKQQLNKVKRANWLIKSNISNE